ncbi:MAG TPA: hypothetical protein VFA10_23090 [Ktedonobacteraceae bacterium]|nr:hypothetical protein [Ktedonobacteraceae bacterium]
MNDNVQAWAHKTLGEQNYRKPKSLWAKLAHYGWSRWTTPPDPPVGATFAQRDTARRALITSAEAFFLLCTVALVGLIGAFGPNKQILNIVIPVVIATIIAVICNRFGLVSLAGLWISGGLMGSMTYSMLTAPGGLSILDTQILFLIAFADLFFVAIMPLKFFWVPGLLNLGISLFVLSSARHSPPLQMMLTYAYFPTFARLLQMHLVCTGVPVILVLIMRRLIKRANNAEAIATLQHELQQRANEQIEQKRELEMDVQQIVTVLTEFSNKNFLARVSLPRIHHLKIIANSLNNLLGRYERLRQEAQELERMREQTPLVMQAIEAAARDHAVFQFKETGTPLDPLLLQLNGKALTQDTKRVAR